RLRIILGRKNDFAVLYCSDGAVGQRLNLDEPLGGKARLNDGLAAVALANGIDVVLDACQQSAMLQIVQDFLPCLIPIQASIRPAVLIDAALVVHNVDLRQVVPQSGLKIVGIMRWSN